VQQQNRKNTNLSEHCRSLHCFFTVQQQNRKKFERF
jgi:hypothetical protein